MFRQWLHRRRLLRERRALAEQRRREARPGAKPAFGLLVDPIESNPQFQPMLAEAERLAEKELAGRERGTGFCHLFWSTKRRILAERFQITWFSPGEMNPDCRFD